MEGSLIIETATLVLSLVSKMHLEIKVEPDVQDVTTTGTLLKVGNVMIIWYSFWNTIFNGFVIVNA